MMITAQTPDNLETHELQHYLLHALLTNGCDSEDFDKDPARACKLTLAANTSSFKIAQGNN